jgi:hypothetical protein
MTKSYKNLWTAARKFTVYSPPLQLPALPPLPHRRRRRGRRRRRRRRAPEERQRK